MIRIKRTLSAVMAVVTMATSFMSLNAEAIDSEATLNNQVKFSNSEIATEVSTQNPTAIPTEFPTENITQLPTEIPTEIPTEVPTEKPTEAFTVPTVTNFKYTSINTNSISLKWDYVKNVDGYVIYRMDNTTNSKYIYHTQFNNNATNTYVDTNVTPARCYYYQIKAFIVKNEKIFYSNPSTLKIGTCPTGVTQLSLKANTSNSIELSWKKVSGASGYAVYRMDYTTNSKYKKLTDIPSTSTGLRNTGLETGRPYYYKIVAYKDVYGLKFEGESAIIKTATLPATVTNLRVKSQSTGNINIQWDRVPRATGYVIYRMDSSTNGKYKLYKVVKGNNSISFNDTGLKAGRCYYYRVRAYRALLDKNFYGGYPTLKTGTKTVTPSFKLKTADNKITATWSNVSGAEGYGFYLSESKNGHYYLQGHTTSTSYTSKTLVPGKTYYIRVCAYNLVNGKKIYSGFYTKYITCRKSGLVAGYDVGNTYIEISLSDQHMWYYKNGVLLASTDVVTGYKGVHDTPKGLYSVIQRKSPSRLVGPTWDVWVNYWIGITWDGVGIHDSTWRTSGYGGNIYTYDGSHGCVNTPFDQTKIIYDNCTIGTPVVIY